MSFRGWWHDCELRKLYRKIFKIDYKNEILLGLKSILDRFYGPNFAELECKKIFIKNTKNLIIFNIYVLHPQRFLDYINGKKFSFRRIDIVQRKMRFIAHKKCLINIYLTKSEFKKYEY